jgi:hypothetical protein
MPNDEFQNEPLQIQKEPSLSDARSEMRLPLPDYNRFQRPDPVRNPSALTALCLGIVSLILSGGWLMMMMSLPNLSASFRLGATTVLGPLQLLLGLTILTFGVVGLMYRCKHPNLGGFGGSMFGTLMGFLTILFGLFLCYVVLGIFAGGGAM